MTLVGVGYEELWEPWEIGENVDPRHLGRKLEIPDDLLERFVKAKAEMETVWQELSKYVEVD